MSDISVLPVSSATASAESAQASIYFSLSERIGRIRYLVYILLGILGCSLLLLFIYLIALMLPVALGKLISVSSFILVKNVLLPLVVFVMAIRRLHDMNANGWWALSILIPFVTLILLILPGQRGENRYGLKPAPNSRNLIAAAIILPVVLFALYFWMVKINTEMKLSVSATTMEKGAHQQLRSYGK
jgi:uncharacterized membrane protein YhaH (DUF805 family)